MNLVPNTQNPLQMIWPTNSVTGQSLIFRFSFPDGSSGLNYRQFFGISFPPSVGSADLNFADSTPKWTCALTDGTNTYAVTAISGTVSPTQSIAAENNIAYCRVDEMTRIPLKSGVNYKLTVTFSVKMASTQYLRSLGFFTSTSNNAERIIIDTAPVFGTVGQYGDWVAFPTKPLDITNIATPTVTTGPSSLNSASTIYPYNSFDLTLSLKARTFININDVYIVVKYPSTMVSAAQSVSSGAILDTNPLKIGLKGTLALSTFSSDSILVSGISEDFLPEREFTLILRGWKALDNVTGATTVDTALRLFVYYKNTYSVFSHASNNIFSVTPAGITISSVAHPESWDIWRNGAWPLRFVFKPNTDLVNGGFVLIQHANAKDTFNKLAFIASSCDFSENDSSFDNTFGKRPNCYPYRLDHDYPDKSTATDYNGSAFFFYVKNLLSSKNYYVTIWAFADNCGGNAATNFSIPQAPTNASVQFSFRITVYKSMNTAALNEARLNYATNVILGQSSITIMTGRCYNAVVGGMTFAASTFVQDTTEPMGFNTGILAVAYQALPQDPTTTITQVDMAQYKEVYDWGIMSASSATSTTAYGADLTEASAATTSLKLSFMEVLLFQVDHIS
jgi:hypothetical protein